MPQKRKTALLTQNRFKKLLTGVNCYMMSIAFTKAVV